MEPDDPQRAGAAQARRLALDICLTAIAGYVDAVAFVRFGGLFVAFMSGDSTKLAALPGLGRSGEAALAAGAVVLFVAGAFAGRLMRAAAGAWRRPALLCVTAALLALAALAGASARASDSAALGFSLAAMALAMGVMTAVLARAYATGALVRLGEALANVAMGRGAPWAIHLLSWLALVLGAAVGGQAAMRLGLGALAVPAAFAALLALFSGGLVRRAGAGGRAS